MDTRHVREAEEAVVGIADVEAHAAGVEHALVGEGGGALVSVHDRHALSANCATI